ncbi:MAG TPA: R3H domain-containing nucleic acid-binding protein, partial [Pyrinomonadaceae bacterium]|nr:R3H domain-containing nucleic acid-binding protein [Pyrinomonadaceae bacterium]
EPARRKPEAISHDKKAKRLKIYPYALSRERLERAIHELGAPVTVTNEIGDADLLLTLKSHAKRQSQKLREARGRNIEVHILRANTLTQMENFLTEVFGATSARVTHKASEEDAMQEVEEAVIEADEQRRPVELTPQPKHIRRLQHIYIERSGLQSESKGAEPNRRIVIYPR